MINTLDETTRGIKIKTTCSRCKSDDMSMGKNEFFLVCRSCGLCRNTMLSLRSTYALDMGRVVFEIPSINKKSYQRINYFNERIARLCNNEPFIDDLPWFIIENEALVNSDTYGDLRKKCTREDVAKILRSIRLPKHYQHLLRSRKFKKTNMCKERFFNKYMEKWKTIICRLTGIQSPRPSVDLCKLLRYLFLKLQTPFENIRHKPRCDKKTPNCDKKYGCLYNFINYDFLFAKLLQIIEFNFKGFKGVYYKFKPFLPMLGEKIRNNKLRPLLMKMIKPFGWKCPNNE